MMTFSLRPKSGSCLPLIAASVRTRVVSWNDAAERNDSVASEAFVTPSSTGAAFGLLLVLRRGFSFASLNADASIELTRRKRVSPPSMIFTLRSIAAHDDFDVLVVDVDALRAVDLLHFLHEVVLQRGFAADPQDVVRVETAFRDRLAGLDRRSRPAR